MALTRSEICRSELELRTGCISLRELRPRIRCSWHGARKITRRPRTTGTLNERFAALSNARSSSLTDESFLSRDPEHKTFQLNYARADVTARLDGFSSSACPWPIYIRPRLHPSTSGFPDSPVALLSPRTLTKAQVIMSQ